MKKKSTSQSAPARRSRGEGGFLNMRVLIGMFIVLAGVCLALAGFGAFSALAQDGAKTPDKDVIITSSSDPLVPTPFDCSRIHELGIDRQENFRAGAIMIACGRAKGGSPAPSSGWLTQILKKVLAPLNYGGTDVNLITGTETSPHVVQSETYSLANPDNPMQVFVAYNDSRGRSANPINIAGASWSTDGGATFTRLTAAGGQSPFPNTLGDPVALYNKPTQTWFTVWLDPGCGSQGLGGYKSTTPGDPSPASWTHFCAHAGSNDDRESSWADNNPASPFYGRMYISWNDFAAGQGIFVRYSTDNGLTWTNSRQITIGSPFIRNVQITGDYSTGAVYIAGMNEGGGGFPHTCNNLIFRSTDGGNTWTNTYTGPNFPGPGRSNAGYFATMYASPAYWTHEGWGEPAVLNNIVHLVYAASAGADPGNVFYIRSTDGGVTFSAPFQLNTDSDTTKAQWEPNLSISPTGSLFATWYDETPRVAASCQPSSPDIPCYQMYSRKSNDNGVTWFPEMPLSDVATPLPLQLDSGIRSTYAGDYDYGSATSVKHVTSWVDGRNPINGDSQQDAYTDRELVGAATITSAVSRKTHGAAGPFDINLPLTGTAGIECRTTGGTNDYTMVVTFSTNVTVTGSPQAQVTLGTGCIGTGGVCTGNVTVSGDVVTIPLTNVANAQTINVTLNGVNGSTNVTIPMGVLLGDVNGNGAVNASDISQTKSRSGQAVNGTNFRSDVNANGSINAADVALVKAKSGTVLP